MSDNSTTNTCSIPNCGCGWTPTCGFCQPWHQNYLLIIILIIILVILLGLLIYCCLCCCCWRKKISSKVAGGKGFGGLVHVSIINTGCDNGKRSANGSAIRSDNKSFVEVRRENRNHETITNSDTQSRRVAPKNGFPNKDIQYKEIILEHKELDEATRPKFSTTRTVDPRKINEIESAVQEVEDLLRGLRWERELKDGSGEYELVLEGLPLEEVPKNYVAVKEPKKSETTQMDEGTKV